MTFTCGKLVGCNFILILRAWATGAIPGLAKLHANSQTPKKKPRGGQLSAEDKRFNRELARQRVVAEHINRQLKIFRILAERYRNRGRRFGLRCNLIAALYNFELKHTG